MKIMDIQKATLEELLKEYKEVEKLWSKYSCDCLGFEITALHNRIMELGGFK